MSVDPLFDITDPQSWSGYAYSDNNPATKSDPDGQNACVREEGSGGCRWTDQTGTVRDDNGRSHGPTSNKNYCDHHNCDPTVFPANGPVPKPPVVIHFTPVYTFYPKSPEQGIAIFDYMLKRCEFGSSSLAAACSGYFGPCNDDVGCKMQQSLLYSEACSHFEGVCSRNASWNSFVDALGAAGGAFGFEGHGPEGVKAERNLFGGGGDLGPKWKQSPPSSIPCSSGCEEVAKKFKLKSVVR
ncbi:hypothetical protein [Actinoallomurus acaciae]|uniref:RHS repeat-associated core domain-containing protein n=1 Tax=Actinoallomurus acaciae TaxID=502577 RepID=A0ABV5YCB9_9ACTN